MTREEAICAGDCISRQAAVDAIAKAVPYAICDESTESYANGLTDAYNLICQLPTVQPEPHYCKECKWSRCHINVDKHGNSKTYWWCLNWDGGTAEEGYCHDWERREDEVD